MHGIGQNIISTKRYQFVSYLQCMLHILKIKKMKNKKDYKNYERYTFCNMPDIKIMLSMGKVFLYPVSHLHMAIWHKGVYN